MDEMTRVASIIGIALIFAAGIYAFARLRIEQERTFQKLIDRGLSSDELLRSAGVHDRRSKDLRRGILLIAVGVAWTGVMFFQGGTAWIIGAIPIVIGLAFVLLRVLDGGPR